jgi:hypothetical protein
MEELVNEEVHVRHAVSATLYNDAKTTAFLRMIM